MLFNWGRGHRIHPAGWHATELRINHMAHGPLPTNQKVGCSNHSGRTIKTNKGTGVRGGRYGLRENGARNGICPETPLPAGLQMGAIVGWAEYRQVGNPRVAPFPTLRSLGLAAFVQNALPDAVDGLLELWSGCGSNPVQVRLGRTAHDQGVLFRHAAPDRIASEQLGRPADRSNPRPQRALFGYVHETSSFANGD